MTRGVVVSCLLGLVAVVLVLLFRDQASAVVDLMGSYSGTPWAIGVALLVFLIGSVLFVPQWMLIAASVAAFGLVEGTGIAWLATMVATTVHLLAAQLLRQPLAARLSGARLEKLQGLLGGQSFQAGFLVRLVPTGPAVIVNVAAGIFGVGRLGFLLGTAMGIVPKILITGALVSEIVSSAQARQASVGLAVIGALILLWIVARRLLRRRGARQGAK